MGIGGGECRMLQPLLWSPVVFLWCPATVVSLMFRGIFGLSHCLQYFRFGFRVILLFPGFSCVCVLCDFSGFHVEDY